ncbi:MAG TPA: plastocyanin/azurin family copper-binding protein [Thermoanaerobaculia bacterium]
MKKNRAGLRGVALLGSLFVMTLAVTCSKDNNNVVGPAPAPNVTPTPGGSRTPTPGTNPNPTPTAPSGSMNATVNVGQGGGTVFMDQQSGSSTTTIRAGGTVNWVWVSGTHSTTSGTCPGSGECDPDGNWDSGIGTGTTFQKIFSSPGTFHYFCRVHDAMMQGDVIVQ